MQEFQALQETVRYNCNVSDARHAGSYSICGLALRLRDLYKWENELDPWIEKDAAQVLDWIEHNPVGRAPAWDPYPLSRRITNWVKWVRREGRCPDGLESSLATQAEALSGTLEYHLLANHLLANAVALVAAGSFFKGEDGDRWLRAGSALLVERPEDRRRVGPRESDAQGVGQPVVWVAVNHCSGDCLEQQPLQPVPQARQPLAFRGRSCSKLGTCWPRWCLWGKTSI